MTPFRAIALLSAATFGFALFPAAAQTQTPPSPPPSQLIEKLNAYVGCINRLSERSYQSRSRYFSWAKQSGPTGKEPIIYGTYTISDTTIARRTSRKPTRWSRAMPRSGLLRPLTPTPWANWSRC